MSADSANFWLWLGYCGVCVGACCVLAGYRVWRLTASAYGRSPWKEACQTLWFKMTSAHVGRWVVHLVMLAALVYLVADCPWSLQLAVGLFAASYLMHQLLPPGILLLGASGEKSIGLRHGLERAVVPFRVVVLLDPSRAEPGVRMDMYRSRLKSDNFWTSQGDWRKIVHPFMDSTVVIVVDCRVISEALLVEIRRILSRGDLLAKTLFLVDSPAHSSALNQLDDVRPQGPVNSVVLSNLIEALRQLGKLTLSPVAEVMFQLEGYSTNYFGNPKLGEETLEADLKAAFERYSSGPH